MKNQPQISGNAKKMVSSPRPSPRRAGFSFLRPVILLLALVAAATLAAALAHAFSPPARMARRALKLAATLELGGEPLSPLETARRLALVQGALAPDATVELEWTADGDTSTESWTGRPTLKDLHALVLAEAPRAILHFDNLRATAAGRPSSGTVATDVTATLRAEAPDEGLPARQGPLRAALLWTRDASGDWKLSRAFFRFTDGTAP